MTQFNRHVLNVILKAPQDRSDDDISMLMPWLEGKIGILAGLSEVVLRDIGKQCEFRQLKNNDIIIRQGEIGDEFFILLSGRASVYIDATISGEKEIFNEQSQMEEPETSSTNEVSEESGATRRHVSTAHAPPNSTYQKRISTVKEPPPIPTRNSSIELIRKRSSTVQVPLKSLPQDRKASTSSYHRPSTAGQRSPLTSISSGRQSRVSTTNRPPSGIERPLTVRERISLAALDDESSNEEGSEIADGGDPRAPFGDYMQTYESGKSFGEMALLSNDSVRNASIISDGDTGLLVVSKTLFDTAFKADQEKELHCRSEFIAQCPLFNWWHPKIRQLLQMSLRRETFQYNYPIVEQGSPFRGLLFILHGSAKVSVSVQQHAKQFPELSAPKKTQVDEIIIRKEIVSVRREAQQFSINLRRKQGYAAAEQFNRSRFHDITNVGEGDIIGDFEVIMNLKEYIYSVTATSHVDAFVLDTKNIERFLNKKHALTMELLTEIVCYKANQRFHAHPDLNMIIFKNIGEDLLEKIENKETRETKKHMTEEEKEIRRQVVLFLHGRIPMVPHSVPNAFFYILSSVRDAPMWNRRIRERELQKQVEHARKMKSLREPRSAKRMKTLVDIVPPAEEREKRTSQAAEHQELQSNQLLQSIMKRTSVARKDGGSSNIWVMLKIFRRLQEVRRKLELKRRSATAAAVGDGGAASTETDSETVIHQRPHTAPPEDWQQQVDTPEEEGSIAAVDTPLRTTVPTRKNAMSAGNLRSKMLVLDPEGKPYFDSETSEPVVAQLEGKLDEFFVKYPVQRGGQGNKHFVRMSRYELRPDRIPLPGGTVLVRPRPCPLEKMSVTHSHTRHYVLPRNALKTLQNFRAMQLERAASLPGPVTPGRSQPIRPQPIRSQPVRPKTAIDLTGASHSRQ